MAYGRTIKPFLVFAQTVQAVIGSYRLTIFAHKETFALNQMIIRLVQMKLITTKNIIRQSFKKTNRITSKT